jgi:hypothetical protein
MASLIADALQQDPELVVTTTAECVFRGLWMIRRRKDALKCEPFVYE